MRKLAYEDESCTAQVRLWIQPGLLDAVDAAARRDRRTRSDWVRLRLQDAVESRDEDEETPCKG